VPVGRDERDPQRFWASVLGALRGTAPGSGLPTSATRGTGAELIQPLRGLGPEVDTVAMIPPPRSAS
jgi:hypothetical protein